MNILVGEKLYEVSSDGTIKKRRGNGYLKQWPDKDGYLRYHVGDGRGKTYNFYVHRLVWEINNGPIPEGYTVDHIDDNKLNNELSNLQLLTPEENAVKGNARHWLVVNPAGEEFEVFNLSAFCREHNLNRSHMYEVASGYKNQTNHKGWKCHERK